MVSRPAGYCLVSGSFAAGLFGPNMPANQENGEESGAGQSGSTIRLLPSPAIARLGLYS